ncbi:WD40 repeat domain-containing protein [Kitasatospora sp. NPDC004240]
MKGDLTYEAAWAESASAEERLTHPGFLVNADPEQIVPLLDDDLPGEPRQAARAYAAAARLHAGYSVAVRRQALALCAARNYAPELAARIIEVPVPGEPAAQWGVDWVTGRENCRFRHAVTGRGSTVHAVAAAVGDGGALAVTGSQDGEVVLRDLASGELVGEPLRGHEGRVLAVATAVVGGRTVVVTGGEDGCVRVWDPAAGEQLGEPLRGHEGEVWSVATAVVDGRTVAVTGGGDGWVRVWDLAPGKELGAIGAPVLGHVTAVWALTAAVVDGRLMVVSGDAWGSARSWNVGDPFTGSGEDTLGTPEPSNVRPECSMLDWTVLPLVEDGAVVATLVVDGRALGVAADDSGTVRLGPLWEPSVPLRGLSGQVCATTSVTVAGRTLLVTGSTDGTVRLWDVADGSRVGPPLVFPFAIGALGAAPEGGLLVAFGSELALLSPR